MIDLEPRWIELVKTILERRVPGCEVRAFGSRVSGGAKKHSDLDLAIVGAVKLDLGTLARLREDFAESDLPMRVDVLDWHGISDEFRAVIGRRYEVLSKPAG